MNSNGHASLAKIMAEKRDKSQWLFDCPGCYGKFPTKKELVEHQQRKLFKCPFKCPQKFTHKYEQTEHSAVCKGRILSGNFDNYKIYQLMDIRHKVRPRNSCMIDQWVKYPYWGDNHI